MKKKLLSLVVTVAMMASMIMGCGNTEANSSSEEKTAEATTEIAASEEKPGEGKSVGFVTFGLGGDFFQLLADEFVTVFEEAGYEAQYADGDFNPTTQIEACENFIAMGVDVLICWSVAPESMDEIVQECKDKGIKFLAFVAPTSDYDAVMISDDADLAANACKLAAKWIDEKYADAEDHSVPVVVLSCRIADTGVIQADELDKIEEYSTKAKFIKEIECANESVDDGMKALENLYATDDSAKVILTPHSDIATGANNYLTGLNSPVQDYSDMAIFAINGDNAMAELIKSSVNDECPLRGMVMTGSVNDTASEMLYVCNGLLDGSLETGHVQKAGTLFIYDETVDEYLETGTVKSVTNEDFE